MNARRDALRRGVEIWPHPRCQLEQAAGHAPASLRLASAYLWFRRTAMLATDAEGPGWEWPLAFLSALPRLTLTLVCCSVVLTTFSKCLAALVLVLLQLPEPTRVRVCLRMGSN